MTDVFENYRKKKDYLVCIDSDGCVMDTMDIKHFQCFGPCMVREWKLEEWKTQVLKLWNDINLYTMTRGINRFKGLEIALKKVDKLYIKIDGLEELSAWVASAGELSNYSLKVCLAKTESSILKKALVWSEEVNRQINALPDDKKVPFSGVEQALQEICQVADVVIVSSANQQAIQEEWEKHGLLKYATLVLSQDAGTKAYCIRQLVKKGYDKEHILMIGDAPGDREAALSNDVLYFPILVKKERESWKRVTEECLQHFLNGSYLGNYQEQLNQEFEENLT